MISYPASLKAVGGARTGIAPVNLLDVLDVNGNVYLWSDRPVNAPFAIQGAVPTNGTPPVSLSAGQQVAWSYPTSASVSGGVDGTHISASIGGGSISSSWTAGATRIGVETAVAQWSDFQAPPLPPGAVIDGIYAVMSASGEIAGEFLNEFVVTAQNPAQPGVLPQIPIVTGLSFSGQAYANMGGTLQNLTTLSVTATFMVSDWNTSWAIDVSISFVGVAIYYSQAGGGAGGSGSSGALAGAWLYRPWLLSVPSFSFHRSLQTDSGSFVLQNLSGDTLSRDFEKIQRSSTLEGAFFIYRLWQPDAQAAWIEVHGTLTVGEGVDTAELKGTQLLNPSQDDTPLETYCETCQLQWGGRRCGSTQSTECSYSFQTCQVVERIMVVMNNYEKNFGETAANTALNVINRRRKI